MNRVIKQGLIVGNVFALSKKMYINLRSVKNIAFFRHEERALR